MIGLDVGGANTKAAVVDGDGPPRIVSEPFEVWREPEGLRAAIGYEKLLEAFVLLARQPELTALRTHLDGIDPDEVFSVVPYEKGYLFLKTLEAAAGSEAFGALLATWLRTHRFGAATTEDFLALVEQELPGLLAKVDVDAWIDGPLLPAAFWKPESARLAAGFTCLTPA